MKTVNYENINIKYEHGNITKMIKNLDIVKNNYTIQQELKVDNKKGIYLIENLAKEKYILKAKLHKFVSQDELLIHQELMKNPHPNLMKITNICKSKNFFIIIYNYINGDDLCKTDLFDNYKHDIDHIIKDVICGMKHLHKCNIYHRDIRPNNIIVTKNDERFCGILIDFDFAILHTENNNSSNFIKNDIFNMATTFYYYFFYKEQFIISQESQFYIHIDLDLFEQLNFNLEQKTFRLLYSILNDQDYINQIDQFLQ